MMGMGEPLANFDNVVTALSIMLDDHGYGLSRRRVTVSTSGMVPQMDRLKEIMPVALAISLHASNDQVRDKLIPLNKKYPLIQLMSACQRYLVKAPRDFITFEYIMLKEINDAPEHARQLIELVKDIPCKFNLIPFNPFINSGFERSTNERICIFREILQEAGFVVTVRVKAPRDFITFEYIMLKEINDAPENARQLIELVKDVPCKFNLIPFNPFTNSGFQRSTNERIRIFREILQEAGFVVTVRKTRGDDIDAACGQLAGKVKDKTQRQQKWQLVQE